MAKQTLLQMTQNILTAMDDDEVNSIGDTVSSLSVAQTIVDAFYELVDELELPGHDSLTRLQALSDVSKPNYLKLPDNFKEIHFVKYADQTVQYLNPQEFVEYVLKRDEGTEVTDFGGVVLKIKTDSDPTYWTTFDDENIVFDSYNSDVESTLVEPRSLVFANISPSLALEDDAIPDLPVHLFSTLLAKAKAWSFVNFKQVSNAKAEQSERRGLVRHQNAMFRSNQRRPYNRTPNYGKPKR